MNHHTDTMTTIRPNKIARVNGLRSSHKASQDGWGLGSSPVASVTELCGILVVPFVCRPSLSS